MTHLDVDNISRREEGNEPAAVPLLWAAEWGRPPRPSYFLVHSRGDYHSPAVSPANTSHVHRLTDWLSWGSMSHSTQNRSFWSRFSKPISWLGMEKKLNPTQQKHAFTNGFTSFYELSSEVDSEFCTWLLLIMRASIEAFSLRVHAGITLLVNVVFTRGSVTMGGSPPC